MASRTVKKVPDKQARGRQWSDRFTVHFKTKLLCLKIRLLQMANDSVIFLLLCAQPCLRLSFVEIYWRKKTWHTPSSSSSSPPLFSFVVALRRSNFNGSRMVLSHIRALLESFQVSCPSNSDIQKWIKIQTWQLSTNIFTSTCFKFF